MAYGVETTFTLLDSAYKEFTGAITEAKLQNGHLSIFGGIYGSSGKCLFLRLWMCPGRKLIKIADGSYTTSTNSWDQLYTHDGDKTITLRAQNVKVPLVLGTVVTTISS
jgi:hypothetical protein